MIRFIEKGRFWGIKLKKQSEDETKGELTKVYKDNNYGVNKHCVLRPIIADQNGPKIRNLQRKQPKLGWGDALLEALVN